MNKQRLPYILIGILAIALVATVSYAWSISKKTNQSASVFSATSNLVNLASGPTATLPAGYRFFDLNNGDGTCWRGIYEDNGTPLALYRGKWASDECRIFPVSPQKEQLRLSITGGSINIKAANGTDYYSSTAGIQLLQLQLVAAGALDATKQSETFTPDVFLAIKSFQAKKSLPATGYVDTATAKALSGISITNKTTPILKK
jgi:hypothetical protein